MKRSITTCLLVVLVACCAIVQHSTAAAESGDPELRKALDEYLDGRWLPKDKADEATEEIIEKIKEEGCSIDEVERLLRMGRVGYGSVKAKGKVLKMQFKGKNGKVNKTLQLPLLDLPCEHVDYKTSFFLVVPKSYKPENAAPLLIVGHGGNGAMSADYATKATLSGILPWLPIVEKNGMILVAPLSERGWGAIGNSIILSLISWTQRQVNIDPDRIYLTGHSMGGHLCHRSAIFLPDRWAAVSPMSGGYDYVDEKHPKASRAMINVPGYATFGKKEPYDINKYNHKIDNWAKANKFDWIHVEKPGGHEIFSDELPKIAAFMLARPRNLYRDRVYGYATTTVVYDTPGTNPKWSQQHTWNSDRPIQRSTFHWLRMYPLTLDAPEGKREQRVWAVYEGDNRFKLISENARKVRIYLHPKMVDFSEPIVVEVNGEKVFDEKVEPDMKTMLELVREFDDRGRIFHAAIDVDISTDADDFPEPRGVGLKTEE
ncbi:MAG: hypothetical protein JW959_08000 [Pirellulales bacterium]|nr:hypothetical protein [Pirellulales bacterium]